MRIQHWLIAGGFAALALALAWQQRSIHRLEAALAAVQPAGDTVVRGSTPPPERAGEPARSPAPVPLTRIAAAPPADADGELGRRVASIEAAVASLRAGAEHLMDEGEIPPTEERITAWRAAFMNGSLPAGERLDALRRLRQNDRFDSAAAEAAAQWLASTTDPEEQEEILQALRGAEDPALKQVMLDLASRSDNAGIRARAAANLRGYGDDPYVESALWRMLDNEESAGVQRRIVDTLRQFPVDEARAARLRNEVLDPGAPIDRRLASLRILESDEQSLASVAESVARAAEQAEDAEALLSYIDAFDDVNHPQFMIPLVAAAQDEDPAIRERAADALVDYRGDPVIQEWLVYLAENDPNPRVRQEASRVFREDGRRGGRRFR